MGSRDHFLVVGKGARPSLEALERRRVEVNERMNASFSEKCLSPKRRLVIVTSGFRGSYIGAFQLDGRGDLQGTEKVAWSWDRNTPDLASPLISGDRLYFHKGKSSLLSCVDPLTGKAHYTSGRIPGLSTLYASPIAAGGHVYITGRSGTTVVIKDNEKLEIVASNSLDEGVDATPAPVDKELFIRGEAHLFCIAEAK